MKKKNVVRMSLTDAVWGALRGDLYPTHVWLEIIEKMLKTGINPNPKTDWRGDYPNGLISMVEAHAKNGSDVASKIERLLKLYDAVYKENHS